MILLVFIAAMLAIGLAAAYLFAFGRLAQRDTGPDSFALPVAPDRTGLDRLIAPVLEHHPEATGLHILVDNVAAFKARLDSARSAERSLDLQYYYWKADLTGRLLGRELIAAADRGVRVRLLLDDINSSGFDSTYIALDSHPNIEVRLFNPSRNRTSSFRRGLELVLKYFTATRRMHNKNWIADGRLAIIGGRNIGDAYFDASESANFRDIDLLAAGKAVRQAEDLFDRYWNSDAALPIRSLHKMRRPKLAKLRRRVADVCNTEKARSFLKLSDECRIPFHPVFQASEFRWVSEVNVMADPPEKAMDKARGQWLGRRLGELLRQVRSDVRIISPYFIPGRAGTETLAHLAASGVNVRVLTNSLAATDVMAVHGAYAKYRRRLLGAGIALYELKPEDGRKRGSLFGSRTASLHTKAFIIDGELGFVGSFNLDPRSASINTEMGILFRDDALARELGAIFDNQTSPAESYRLRLVDGRMQWMARNDVADEVYTAEPRASRWRLVTTALIGLLPIESQL